MTALRPLAVEAEKSGEGPVDQSRKVSLKGQLVGP